MSLFIDDDKDLWIGTQGGGLHIMEEDGKIVPYKNHPTAKVDANTIWRIHEDKASKNGWQLDKMDFFNLIKKGCNSRNFQNKFKFSKRQYKSGYRCRT